MECASISSIMGPVFRSKKILMPDMPPRIDWRARYGLLVAGIGVLCAGGVIALVILLVLYA